MTGKEASKHLGVHRSTLCLMVKDGLIRVTPDPEHARRLIYNKEDVEQVAEATKRSRDALSFVFHTTPEKLVRTLGYNLEELRSSVRFRQVVDQRRVVAAILVRMGHTYLSIGKFLNRNKSTITNLTNSSYLVEREVTIAMQKLTDGMLAEETKE